MYVYIHTYIVQNIDACRVYGSGCGVWGLGVVHDVRDWSPRCRFVNGKCVENRCGNWGMSRSGSFLFLGPPFSALVSGSVVFQFILGHNL